jgi:hypothetical protein
MNLPVLIGMGVIVLDNETPHHFERPAAQRAGAAHIGAIIICPKCKASYRRLEVASGRRTNGEHRCLLCHHILEVFDGSTEVAIHLTAQPEKAAKRRQSQRADYLPLLRGSLMGTCCEVLSTRGPPSGLVRLMSVSKTRKNFSASMCVSSERLPQRRPSGV